MEGSMVKWYSVLVKEVDGDREWFDVVASSKSEANEVALAQAKALGYRRPVVDPESTLRL